MSLICLILRKKREFKEDARKVSTQETTLKPTPRATEKTRVLHVEFCAKTTRGQKTCERTKANDSTFRFDAERVSPRDANLNCSRFTSHRFHTHRYARWFSFASSWKIGRTKKAHPSLHLAYIRERKKYRKSCTFPLTREQRYTRISLKRTSTSSNDHLPKSFTSCVASSAILLVFILCALLLLLWCFF